MACSLDSIAFGIWPVRFTGAARARGPVFKPREDFYDAKEPGASDVLLVVEVADSSLSYDRWVKLPRYARAGIPEVWIEDLQNDVMLVHREPTGDHYHVTLTLYRGDVVSAVAFPEIPFKIDDLLGSNG